VARRSIGSKGPANFAVKPAGTQWPAPAEPAVSMDFHGERRTTADPDARLFRKELGKEARLRFMGHASMENRNRLIVGALTTPPWVTPSGRRRLR
jgi:hypothetical protein